MLRPAPLLQLLHLQLLQVGIPGLLMPNRWAATEPLATLLKPCVVTSTAKPNGVNASAVVSLVKAIQQNPKAAATTVLSSRPQRILSHDLRRAEHC